MAATSGRLRRVSCAADVTDELFRPEKENILSDPLKEMAAEIYMRCVTHEVMVRAMKDGSIAEIDYKRLTEEAWRAAKTFSKCTQDGASSVPV